MDISWVLKKRYSDKLWELHEFDYEGLVWKDESDKPTREELESQYDEVLEEIRLEKEAKENAKDSALQKLSALGLTEEEAKAIVGL